MGKKVGKARKSGSKNKGAKRVVSPSDEACFRAQLSALNLRINKIREDGNCFFRSVADQLDGSPDDHHDYRQKIVDFIDDNEELFEPFIEDDENFTAYVCRMRHEGAWAGHLELQACACVYSVAIVIHQPGGPRLEVTPITTTAARTIHISYHSGEHYNSIRNMNDDDTEAATPIYLSPKDGAAADPTGEDTAATDIEKMVMMSTQCEDLNYVRSVLRRFHGDESSAIEAILEEYTITAGQSQVTANAHDTSDSHGNNAIAPTCTVADTETASGTVEEEVEESDATATAAKKKTTASGEITFKPSRKEMKKQKRLVKARQRGLEIQAAKNNAVSNADVDDLVKDCVTISI
eukprot:GFYU01002197.1.p1 GENE.GFYU01002197.1~~GFYU01002197.1.p1  ORF type:complete len:350 (+),score=97.49 GFYU01002197.1:223-1272(+)